MTDKPTKKKTNAELNQDISNMSKTVEAIRDETNAALDAVDAKFDSLSESIAGLTNLVSQKAKDNPMISSEPSVHGEDGLSSLSSVSLDRTDDDGNVIELSNKNMDVDSPMFKKKAETEAFLAEMVEIFVHDTSERNAAPIFDIGVNGRTWTFIRNRSYKIPRYVLYGLLKAKPVSFSNEEYTDPADGVRKVRYPRHQGLRYHVSIESDTAKGRAWAERVKNEVA